MQYSTIFAAFNDRLIYEAVELNRNQQEEQANIHNNETTICRSSVSRTNNRFGHGKPEQL